MSNNCCSPKPSHFQDKEAIEHVVEAQANGLLSSTEIHGTEIPGHISAGADAARETAVVVLILWLIFIESSLNFSSIFGILAIFCLSWLIWKTGRSAWLGWSRLERMHRIVEQERWEIQHHRQQEREELGELYKAKGFEGKLLEDVLDVLMADEERLLKIMVEEELCLSLSTHEHPLKQGLGATIGTFLASSVCLFAFYIFPTWGMWVGSFLTLGAAAALSTRIERNRLIPAIVWNLGIGAAASGFVYFLFDYIRR
ncbi:MAG TPA: VIT1/CCC1 transporter family protein [Waddliaceae bacterium]